MEQYNYHKNFTRTLTLTFRVAGGMRKHGNTADATTDVALSFLASVYQVDGFGLFNPKEAYPVVVTIEDKEAGKVSL